MKDFDNAHSRKTRSISESINAGSSGDAQNAPNEKWAKKLREGRPGAAKAEIFRIKRFGFKLPHMVDTPRIWNRG
jgi:hypothetical protein